MPLTTAIAAPKRQNNILPLLLIVVCFGFLAAVFLYQAFGGHHGPAHVSQEELQHALTRATLDGTHPCVIASNSDGHFHGELGRCATPTSRMGMKDQFEVDLRYGAFVLRQTDLHIADVFDVPLTRSYDSRDWLSDNPVHAFGRNANHPFDIAPLGTRNPYTYMYLALEDGDLLFFKRISPGTSYFDAVYMHTETATRFYGSTIAWNGDGWTLTLSDGTTIFFPESYGATNLAQGAATEIRNNAGEKLDLIRDRQRNLEQILTPHHQWIRFQRDNLARITKAWDDAGESATYGYNGDGMLTLVSRSSGQKRSYTYQGDLMTSIQDEHGTVLLRNVYRSRILVAQQFADGDTFHYGYTWLPRGGAAKVVVTLPDGSTQEVFPSSTIPSFLLEP